MPCRQIRRMKSEGRERKRKQKNYYRDFLYIIMLQVLFQLLFEYCDIILTFCYIQFLFEIKDFEIKS